jgi:prephenate dehydrogenase
MAGSEKSGYDNSTDYLFENAFYILTPCKSIPHSSIQALSEFIENIGSIPLVMNSDEHDYATASISHVPHIIASSLVNLVKNIDTNGRMKQLAAGGFKDLTRIASSNPTMWQQICISNKDKIIDILNIYIKELNEFINYLYDDNANNIYNFFETAKEFRQKLSEPSIGLIKCTYEIMLDIKDETGVIANIASILSSNQINIENIGIINNREHEQGILKIVFYDKQSQLKSKEILSKLNYIIYEN